jgi:hypothetical protein
MCRQQQQQQQQPHASVTGDAGRPRSGGCAVTTISPPLWSRVDMDVSPSQAQELALRRCTSRSTARITSLNR